MIFEGKRWTYSQLNDRANRLANGLFKLGVEKGDRIGIIQVNCNQYIESYFACAKLGAILVPLNFRAKADELNYMIANAKAKVLLMGNRYTDLVNSILPQLLSVKESICFESNTEGMRYYEDIIESSSPDEYFSEIEDEDITILMYTAGTTGRPKGVPLSHGSFAVYILENVEPASPEIEERNLLTVPLYHVAGMQAVMAAVYGGRTLVLMKQFEVKEWLGSVQKERVTRAMLVPTMLKRVIDDPDFAKYDLSSLQVITYGAEGTEEEKEIKLKRLTSSIGKPLSDVEVKIIDEQGSALPPHEVGEIAARGPRIVKSYWGDEEKSSGLITDDGWLHTGDMGWMDEDGYIYLAGRGDDMIIRGGENISPEEVEDVLYSYTKVEEAAIIGIHDPEWGQQPLAVVVLKEGQEATEEEIIEYCRPKLAGFKRPTSVIFVDSLPRNPMGKLLKRVLVEQYGQG
jgi:acyl-CoA synthetase (AMP-forming)/AMP-acid ligase II